MKAFYTLLIAAFILVAIHTASAQTNTVRYYSKSGKKQVPASEAHFFEIEERKGDWGGTRTRYLLEDSSKVSMSTYSHLKGGQYGNGTLDGPYYEWYKSGKLKTEAAYIKDELSGKYRQWYDNGQLHYTKNYRNYKLQDTLTAYYETGKLRRIEVYADDELISGKLYDETGRELGFFPMEQMPRYPGGEQSLMRQISRNLRYPKSAQQRGVGGMVLVAFMIQEDGSISDVEVMESVDPDLDAEAVRVIKALPKWEPGMEEGKPKAVSFTAPIVFVANKKWDYKL